MAGSLHSTKTVSEAAATEGGGGGLYGIYETDPIWSRIAENAKFTQGLNAQAIPECSIADAKKANIPPPPACPAGKEGGSCALDVNECLRGLDNCDPNAACVDTDGGFTCECFYGYSGDGASCTEDAAAIAGGRSVVGRRSSVVVGGSFNSSKAHRMATVSFELAIGRLDEDDPIKSSLRAMRCATSSKHQLKALKTTLQSLGADLLDASPDVANVYVPILVELAFVESATFIRCYFNSVKTFPDRVLAVVTAGWAARLRAAEAGDLSIDDVAALELVSTILAVDEFSAIWGEMTEYGLKRVERALDTALREAGGAGSADSVDSVDGAANRFDEAAEKVVEKAASIGYAIVAKRAAPVDRHRSLLGRCVSLAVGAIAAVEEPKVEFVLAQLVGGLGCALFGLTGAVDCVLGACFGEGSEVVRVYRSGALGRDWGAHGDEFSAALEPLGARAFVVCATMAPVVYGEAVRLRTVPAFSEAFALSICSAVEGEHGHTQFVRLYCVDALSAYLGAYLHASRNCSDGVDGGDGVHCGEGNRASSPGAPPAVEAVLSQETETKVMETLALRSLTCDEYVARRITDGFLRVMFEIDAHQARGSAGKPAELAVRTIKVCADMPVSKATFRLWDAILQHVYAPVVLDRHPRLVRETIDAISTNKHDVRAAASSALRNVWKAMSVGAIDRPNSSESHSSSRAMGRFDAAESERIVLDVAAALEAANLRGDGTLDSIITHVLPGLMQSCPKSFGLLIRRLNRTEGERSPKPTTRAGTASVVSDARPLAAIVGLLSVGKRTGCYADFRDLHRYGIDSFGILREAVVDSREDVRLAALELVCAGSVATIDIPPAEELAIMNRYFDAAMLCTSAVARQQNITSFGRFLTRIKLSAAAIITRPQAYDAADHEAVEGCESWMQDICRRCIACLHPGAVYGKKLMAIELLSTSMQVFRELVCEEERGHAGDGDAYHSGQSGVNKRYQERRGHSVGTGLVYGTLRPFPEELYGTSTHDNLLGSLADNFERIRSLAMSITLMLPPNRSSNVRDMLDYAFDYVRRPRLSDQDAGARMMFIVHEQFLVPGTWRVDMRSIDDFDAVSIVDGPTEVSEKEQDTDFVGQLAAVAVDTVPDLSGLGVLLAYLALLRHLVAGSSFSEARNVDTFTKVVHLVEHTVRLIMPVLSRPEENVLGEGVEGGEGGADESASLADLIQSRASDEQLIRCRSWMASREICITIQSLWNAVLPAAHGLFEAGLRATVDALMHVLLRAQHYGSIDSAKATLQHICSTRGGSGALVDATTRSCVDVLFEHMLRPDQTRRDAIRRSGGMPFGLQSVMVSAPKSRISSVIMERLLEICESGEPGESGESTGPVGPAIADGRDNAVHWPKVHALNVLRLVYSDPRLSALDRYHGVGFTVVLKSLSDPSWEVQNSAALCFTSLVISKVMGGGTGNVRRVDHVDTWPSRALSAEGFLGRYRDVDQFMIGVLGSGVENSMLAPVLALLGRLKPQSSPPGGTAVGDAGRSLPAPGATATIQRYSECLARHLGSDQIHIRKMAARACVSVVPATSWLELVAAACPPTTAPTSGAITGCSNRLHGQLCLVVEIFKAIYSLSYHADGAHEDLFHAIVASFCGAYRSPMSAPVALMPAPCQAELLKTCIVMCRLASKFRNDQVTSFCAAVVDDLWQGVLVPPSTSGSPSRSSAPMETVAMKRLVRLNLTWLLPTQDMHEGTGDQTTWMVPFLEYSNRLVQSPVVDVREATLKSILATDIILKALDSKSARVHDACDRLISTIRRAWEGEEGFYVKILMLQVTNAAGIGADITGWRIHARNPLLLAEIVRSCAYAGADILAAMLAETSLPHQTEEVRAASVEALGIAPALLAPERLDMWTCALNLLVDEEEEIRSHMAHIVDRVIADDPEDRDDPRDASTRSHARSRSHGRAEVVQERVFSWLLQQCNGSRATVEWVFGYIVDSPTSLGNVIRDRIASKGDRVLFLVEKANQHEDPIRYAQLAANALKDLGLDLGPRLGPDPSAAPWDGLRARGEACARVLHEISCDPAIQALSFGDLQRLRYQTHEAVYRLLLGARVAGISCTVCDEGGQPLFRVDASHNGHN